MTTVLNDIIPNPVIKQWILTVPPNTVYDHKTKSFLLELKKSEMNLTEDQLEEFDEAFNFFDSDRDGLINEKTLGKMFKFMLLNDRINTAVVLNFYLRVVRTRTF